MLNPPNKSDTLRQADYWDVAAVCWCVFAALLFGGALFGAIGQAAMLTATLLQLLFAVAYLMIRRLNVVELLRWNRSTSYDPAAMLCILLGGVVTFDSLDRLINYIYPIPPEQLESMQKAFTWDSLSGAALVIGTVGVLGPVIEESLFRGMVQQVFERRKNVTTGVLWTSLIFTLIHFQPWWTIQLLLFSVLLGYLAWRYGSIFQAALLHSANNIWSLIALQASPPKWLGFYYSGSFVHPLISLIGLAVLILGLRLAKER